MYKRIAVFLMAFIMAVPVFSTVVRASEPSITIIDVHTAIDEFGFSDELLTLLNEYDWIMVHGFIVFKCETVIEFIFFYFDDPHWPDYLGVFGDNPITKNGRLVPNSSAMMQAGNLYVYCKNNPIRWIDPTGLWTKDIHEELTRLAMDVLATENPELAGMLLYHANFIVKGNLRIDEDPYRAMNFMSTSAQSRHFNRNSSSDVDSRIEWGEMYLQLAIDTWLTADYFFNKGWFTFDQRYEQRTHALYLLGRGLHSIQDIEAHGDIGMGWRGALFAVHVQGWRTDCKYHDWRPGSRRWVEETNGQVSVRFMISAADSLLFIERFYQGIGMF